MTDEQYNSIMAELADIKRRLPKQETTIRGTLTRDAETRTTAKGRSFTKLNIKCSEQYNGSMYVNAVYWGNLRQTYFAGDRIYRMAIVKMDKKGKCPWWEYKGESKK